MLVVLAFTINIALAIEGSLPTTERSANIASAIERSLPTTERSANIASAIERSLPTTERPLWVYRVFSSPVGEVQFAKSLGKPLNETTVFLRTTSGSVCRMVEILGEDDCRTALPMGQRNLRERRCVYLFNSEQNQDCAHRLFSYELRDSSIFGVVNKVNRGKMGNYGTF